MIKTKVRPGFTIVELLIVIVVIAILATITIVAFNGIQNKAHDVATQSNVRQIVTGLEIMKSETNGYYMVSNAESSTNEVCIGESPNTAPSCGANVVAGAGCSSVGLTPSSTDYPVNYSSAFNQELKKYIGTVPRGVQSKSYLMTARHATQDCTQTRNVSGAIYHSAKRITVNVRSDGTIGSFAYYNGGVDSGTGAFSIAYTASEDQCKVSGSLLGGAKGTITMGSWSFTSNTALCYVFAGDVTYVQT